jgi:hypothetical protein
MVLADPFTKPRRDEENEYPKQSLQAHPSVVYEIDGDMILRIL